MIKIVLYPNFAGVDVKEKNIDGYKVYNIPMNDILRNEVYKDEQHFKSDEKLQEYLKKMESELQSLPPIILIQNPLVSEKYNILDGHHRFHVYSQLGKETIPSIIVDEKSVYLAQKSYGQKNNTAIRLDKVPESLDLRNYFNTGENESQIEEKWSQKYKNSIDCNNPKGFSQRAHCQGRKKKKEVKETGADSAGSFEAPLFGKSKVIKRPISHIPNMDLTEEEEMGEATLSSSSGAFDVPAFGKTTKGGRKNPLKIDGKGSEYQGRAVKDKKFPRWGGPNAVFVKVKEKCKKFPYCNQGNTGAIEFIKEDQELQEIITDLSKKYKIPHQRIETIILNEIKQIFI